MPQSFSKVLLHTVFSTKERKPFLQDASVRQELYAYLATVLKNCNCPALIIGGVEDHVHMLHLLSRTITVADMIEDVKASTSKWIKSKGLSYRNFYWQNGYGVFSVSESNAKTVTTYIRDQEKHHKKMSFQEELRGLCDRHGVELDERYVWD